MQGGQLVMTNPQPCYNCRGAGRMCSSSNHGADCPACDAVGYFGIDPKKPCPAGPGSKLKAATLAKRYRDGLPLWHPLDGNSESLDDNR